MRVLVGFLSLLLIAVSSAQANDEFPGRSLYLDVPHIELDELAKRYDEVIIVDVRSGYEYDTLHIKKAINISLGASDYVDRMHQLRQANPDKTIVTYCNGKTCMKSYKAARKALQRGVENVVSFDAGIMDWAQNQPERSVLLGESPLDPAKLIAKPVFKQHLIKPEEFVGNANRDGNMIVDARDPLQRAGYALFMGKEHRASLADEKKMGELIAKAARTGETMYIYDEAGKQVRWLMYRLEQRGVKDYYFMEGGTNAFYKKLREEFAKGD
ncbi:rhodanese-like domain-containing protein [Thiohalophilus sp.]|uniref:rhodanese-like domain-containing protein n=1 Tax=Thiohalophilus sp. TaxID=3028392 RepID=UPI002ACDFE74|nr:rhodanese-like domain-containing protein [Thiohalophilus sp.]MDZ7661617.1 rhodanese-like domain-containing protein [Thiohalophilus sp.]MDZ7803588.1 rhodanese-like domain-containing protein [Thiohalophilus sp.]